MGRWLRATLLGQTELRDRLKLALNGDKATGWSHDEPAVVEAACELAVRRFFGPGYDIGDVTVAIAELREATGGNPQVDPLKAAALVTCTSSRARPTLSRTRGRLGGHLRRGRRRQHRRRFAKDQFTLDFAAGQLTCPAGVVMPVEPGKTVRFPKDTCAACPLQARSATSSNGRSVSIHPDEALLGPPGQGGRPGRERWSLPVHLPGATGPLRP